MFLPLGDDVDNRTLPVVGTFLVVLNVLVFAAECRAMSPPPGIEPHSYEHIFMQESFFKRWGLVPAHFLKGKVIGLVGYMFLHGDFMHLFGNMIVLWAFVRSLENAFGEGKFFFFYILWGLVSGISHAVYVSGHNKLLPLVGASGAIAGLIGAYWVLFGARTYIKTYLGLFFTKPIIVDIPAGAWVFIWVFFQVWGLADESEGIQTGVAYMCHMGGFVAGVLTALPFRRSVRRRLKRTDDGVLTMSGHDPVQPALANLAAARGFSYVGGQVHVPQPEICGHCGTPLSEASQLAPHLLQCRKCNKLHYC